MSAEAAVPLLSVTVLLGQGPRQTRQVDLRLPLGSTAAQAVLASGLLLDCTPAQRDQLSLALWGKACGPEAVLHDHDRLELLRALVVDPKEARRLRYRRDGVRPAARRVGRTDPGPERMR